MIFEVEEAFIVTRDRSASFTGLNPGEMFLWTQNFSCGPIFKIFECIQFGKYARSVIADAGKSRNFERYIESFNSDDCFHILSIESTIEEAMKACDYYLVNKELR